MAYARGFFHFHLNYLTLPPRSVKSLSMPIAYAPAKVNLTLNVGAAKANGRHALDSLTVFAGPEAADRITAEPADTIQIGVIGPYAEGCGPIGENLVFKAAHGLRATLKITQGVRLTLVKHLPVAAGIGGGSADAAATLRLLNALWDGPDDPAHLFMLAEKLGGDVPACLASQPVIMRGEGERLYPFALPAPIPALLVNPGIACPTGPIFRAFDASGGGADFAEDTPPRFESLNALFDWLQTTYNDLEPSALIRHPEIAVTLAALAKLPGARLTRMSGSGATCFALFETLGTAQAAAATLKASQPGWWIVATMLGGLG